MLTANPLVEPDAIMSVARDGRSYRFRRPVGVDVTRVWDLIARCPPLEANSLYCNLLQCTHFADTCIIAEAEQDGQLRGWVSAYHPPKEPQTLFVWQVAVHPDGRGCGLGRAMLKTLLQRATGRGTRQLKATIAPDNQASWGLFQSLANALNVTLTSEEHFDSEAHFCGQHKSEHMVTIGL